MKKQAVFFFLLFFALAGVAQDQSNNPLNIKRGVALIDGQNNTYEGYTCNSSETSWTAKYTDVKDSENVRIFYYKTTAENCTVSFPDSTLIPQGNGRDGVTVSGKQITLESSAKGFFLIIIVKDLEGYKVSCTRITD